MTPQEIFDKVWDHLNRQGKPAIGDNEKCMYRAQDGSACAVGCLIDDDTAKQWEGEVVYEIDDLGEELEPHRSLLEELQQTHDFYAMEADWLRPWRARMRNVATIYNLTVPPIPEGAA